MIFALKNQLKLMWNRIVYLIGDCIEATFPLLERIGPWFNDLCVIGALVGIGIWLKMQSDYNKEASQRGTLK